MLKPVSLILTLLALGAGLASAWTWWRASRVEIDLGYAQPGDKPGATVRRIGIDIPRSPEPVIAELRQMNELAAQLEAARRSARLNKDAALWAAVAAASATAATIAGALRL